MKSKPVTSSQITKRLAALCAEAAQLMERIAHYKFVLDDISGVAVARKQEHAGVDIRKALALRAQQAGTLRAAGDDPLVKAIERAIKLMPAGVITSRNLRAYLRTQPVGISPAVIGRTMQSRGYRLSGVGSGAKWIPKAPVNPHRKARPAKASKVNGHASKITQRRALAVQMLSKFSTDEPREPADVLGASSRIGPYVRSGYLAKRAGGYVRTDKEFRV
jgi:hypothetical protein